MSLRALQGPTGGGTPVGGTGTSSPSTIPRWTGPSTLGDSVITQSTNARAIGVGVTASASWDTAYRAIQLGQTASAMAAASQVANWWTQNNGIWDGTNWTYTAAGAAAQYAQVADEHRFFVCGAGAAGANITWTRALTINSAGNVGIGTASPGASLHVLSTGANPFIFASTQTTTYLDIRTSTSTSVGYVGTGGMVVGGAANDLALRAVPAGSNVIIAGPGGALRGTFGSTALDVSHVSGYGLKLPATPGNADTQTLDCYLDGGASGGATWTPVDNSGAGLTFTVTSARYMRIGRLVLASFDITFPATASVAQAAISLPVTAQSVWQGASIGYGPNIPGLSATVINADLNFWTYLAATTNAALSGTRLIVSMSYFAN